MSWRKWRKEVIAELANQADLALPEAIKDFYSFRPDFKAYFDAGFCPVLAVCTFVPLTY